MLCCIQPVEVGIAGLSRQGFRIHAPHRMLSAGVIQELGRRGQSVKNPAHGAVGRGIAVAVSRFRITLVHFSGVTDVEKSLKLPLLFAGAVIVTTSFTDNG